MHQEPMRRPRWSLRIVLLGIAVTLPGAADAPNSGDDRQYEAFDTNSRTILDRFTRLEWERPPSDPYPAPMKFADAKAYCATVSGGSGGTGKMRLPSLKELLTIVDEDPHKEYDGQQEVDVYIDQSAFNRTPRDEFWTSSMSTSTKAFTVDFGTGGTQDGSVGGNDLRYVRCVFAR
jgi:hypothetical protein